MKWVHGTNNAGQEYYHPRHTEELQVVQNRGEPNWVIYDLRGESVEMVKNPHPSKGFLGFREITDIPSHGQQFGDSPHHDGIGKLDANYAWDTAQAAMEHVEGLLR